MAGLIEAVDVGRQDLYSPIDQPPFARSPLDGYALRGGDVKGASPENPAELNVVDEIFAGLFHAKDRAARSRWIATGALIPEGRMQ